MGVDIVVITLSAFVASFVGGLIGAAIGGASGILGIFDYVIGKYKRGK